MGSRNAVKSCNILYLTLKGKRMRLRRPLSENPAYTAALVRKNSSQNDFGQNQMECRIVKEAYGGDLTSNAQEGV